MLVLHHMVVENISLIAMTVFFDKILKQVVIVP